VLPDVGRTLQVLLAEDNPVNQRLAVRLLETRGHKVETVGTGKEALAALERRTFDLILMDLQMPELGGLETTAFIREREAAGRRYVYAPSTRIPIVALTAHAMAGDREQCLAGGMDGYVTKPIQAQDLFTEIERVLASVSESRPQMEGASHADSRVNSSTCAGVAGDEALFAELVPIFLENCPRELHELHEALNARDGARLARAAHALKGSVGCFGPSAALELVREMEQAGRNQDMVHATKIKDVLESAVANLQESLSRRLTHTAS
jgi:protein-histidine pros-kinase